MKNKEFQKLLRKNKFNSNSGFTLTELLVGLFMSTFVIGALGFGLMSILRVTQKGNSETLIRNESSRALDFISDEMRRAIAIDVDMDVSKFNTEDDPSTVDVDESDGMIAPDYDLPTGGNIRLSLQIPGVVQRVIYSAAPPANDSPWKGPLVIYRWGPNLDANGNYTNRTNTMGWQNQALVDGISDVNQTVSCDTDGNGTDETITYKGFFACVEDDGDGQAITAQLYLTGQTKGADGYSASTYSADTITVARARSAPSNNSEDLESFTMSFKTLDSNFACGTTSNWKMRTDFGNSLTDPDSISQWNHDPNKPRQPQPITITGDTLVISSIPRDATGDCNNDRTGNGREGNIEQQDFAGNKTLGESEDWTTDDKNNVVAISHVIDFNDPTTFNGNEEGTCDSDYICGGSNGGKVNTKKSDDTTAVNPVVRMLKRGSIVPDYGGYDANGNGVLNTGDQPSLGEFLHTQTPSLASKTPNGTDVDGNIIYQYQITNELQPNERIIGFEIGQTSDADDNSGFDLQDNIFIIKSEKFNDEYDYTPIP